MVGKDQTTQFRVAVVGKGMIGSAAARHLAQQTDGVALIGPDEPPVRADHHDVFGSHYDEGRIYRVLDGDPIWARLAERSMRPYAEIEVASGIPFHERSGCWPRRCPPRMTSWKRTPASGPSSGVEFERLTS